MTIYIPFTVCLPVAEEGGAAGPAGEGAPAERGWSSVSKARAVWGSRQTPVSGTALWGELPTQLWAGNRAVRFFCGILLLLQVSKWRKQLSSIAVYCQYHHTSKLFVSKYLFNHVPLIKLEKYQEKELQCKSKLHVVGFVQRGTAAAQRGSRQEDQWAGGTMPRAAVSHPAGLWRLPEGQLQFCTAHSYYSKVTNTLHSVQSVCFLIKWQFVFQSQTMVSNLEKSLHDLQTEQDALKLQQQKVRT